MYTRGMNECGAPAGSGGAFKGPESRLERQIATVRQTAKMLADDPNAKLPAAAALGLGAGGPYTKVGEWTPQTTPKGPGELRFDVTSFIAEPGAYTVRLLYQSGRHGVTTCAATLLADDKEVAKDNHKGWSGASQFDHVYTLEPPQVPGMKKWILVVTIDGRQGTDSTGNVEIRREQE